MILCTLLTAGLLQPAAARRGWLTSPKELIATAGDDATLPWAMSGVPAGVWCGRGVTAGLLFGVPRGVLRGVALLLYEARSAESRPYVPPGVRLPARLWARRCPAAERGACAPSPVGHCPTLTFELRLQST